MRLWVTEIRAINPLTGELTMFAGPNVPGISWADAGEYCQNNGLGYCKVTGPLVAEIPTKADGITADWANRIDYDQHNN